MREFRICCDRPRGALCAHCGLTTGPAPGGMGLLGILANVQNGQPGAVCPSAKLSSERRWAISWENYSSVRYTPCAIMISMLSIERCPRPDQLRGSTTFLFAGVLSKYPVVFKIVPRGNSGAASSSYA